ncbi:MAG: Zn-dependent hydrolase [Candidatus Promineifilaceae bacterium]
MTSGNSTVPQIDRERFLSDFAELRQIGLQPDGAVHRVGYSSADLEARHWLKTRLSQLGLNPIDDAAGNTSALYTGLEPLPPIGIGSHTDTVPMGGAYDGALGVIAALAIIEALHRAGKRLRHPVELINFAAEEATMAGGTTGSQAMAGTFNLKTLDKLAWDGKPVRAHLLNAGLVPDEIISAERAPNSFAAFLELHIEQSKQLETTGADIAVVDSFVGIRRYAIRFDGQANHAGTTPMHERRDALLMASPMVQFVNEMAIELGIVGTIGSFAVHPGAPNVIPERVELVVEIRGPDAGVLDQARGLIEKQTAKLGGVCETIVEKPPVQADAIIQQAIEIASAKVGLRTHQMSSGAGHDVMNIGLLCPIGILFVPSKDGISHSKDEFTSAEACVNGAQVYLEALLALDEML